MDPVKLPKEVLDMFPSWEYRCPCCGTYIESVNSFCPNCKTAFDQKKWRVPPKFLKSPEAMSTYAHEVLAPKLSLEQRELLFQYFTELFNDGFENGNFNAWTTASGTPTIVESPVHHGNYATEMQPSGDYLLAELPSTYSTLYQRAYVYFSSLPSSGQCHILGIYPNNYSSHPLCAEVYWNGSNPVWSLFNRYYGNRDASSTIVQTGQWYCVELKYLQNGSSLLYVNETQEASLSIQNIAAKGLRNGYSGISNTTITYYLDCVIAADTYIGPETETQTYTKTWTTDVLFKKLDITKTLGMDTAFQKQDVPKIFGVDAALQKSVTVQGFVDSLFKAFDAQKSFSLDACFGGLTVNVLARQFDSVFKKLDATKAFGLDVYFGSSGYETCSKSFGLNAVFAYKVRLPELWLDENGNLVLNISKPYTWVGT